MNKTQEYRSKLRQLPNWDIYLLAESRLPGPRANLELLYAVVEEGDADTLLRYASLPDEAGSSNTPQDFLACCGTAGLGRLIAEGLVDCIPLLRQRANDTRWRVREAVAMALQRWGDADLPAMTAEAERWASGSRLEQRAVVAGLCEPRLLASPEQVRRVLALLDRVTEMISEAAERKSEEFRVLRQCLGYAWSVAAAALPDEGKAYIEKWLACPDTDIQWIMRENFKKKRLKGIIPLPP